MLKIESKECSLCHTVKRPIEFYKREYFHKVIAGINKRRIKKTVVLANTCKQCHRSGVAEYRRNNYSKLRSQYLKRKYGVDDVVSGQCQICSDTFKTLVVDHDHQTGRLRGYLCRRCNVLLGMAKDQSRVLLNAIRYLTAYYERNQV